MDIKQLDLLRLLIANHLSTGGAEFYFSPSSVEAELSYRRGEKPVPVSRHDVDQLADSGYIILTPVSTTVHRGKPTELGVKFVHRMLAQRFFRNIRSRPGVSNFAPSVAVPLRPTVRPIRSYEEQCPFLDLDAFERLSAHGVQRDQKLSENIERAEVHLRERREELKTSTDKRRCKVLQIALVQETKPLREKVISAAGEAAADGVREFANRVLLSRNGLGGYLNVLRQYTALLVAELRSILMASQVFQMVPLSPWREDPIAQKAIHTCEEILFERWKMGDGRPYDSAAELNGSNLSWSPVVLDWEAFKAAKKIERSPRERIRESVLRTILSRQHHMKPDDVTDDQISQAGADLCCHYGSVLIIPLDWKAGDPPKVTPESVATFQFWQEREEEFRKHNTKQNALLAANWLSWGDRWRFHIGGSACSPSTESLRLFKAVATEAARGLGSSRGLESWIDWLDLLRSAKDEGTGESLYAKVVLGSCIVDNLERARMLLAGEALPAGALNEFVTTADGVKKRLYWDASRSEIQNLFRNSANFCLELRSSALRTTSCAPDPPVKRNAILPDASPQHTANTSEREQHVARALNVDFIREWIKNEGYTNEVLAGTLKLSARAVSSLRNDGDYHGDDAVTKLANLMGCDVDDLYWP